MFTMQDAEREPEMAGALNPGRWVDHSRATAQNAGLIAEKDYMEKPEGVINIW